MQEDGIEYVDLVDIQMLVGENDLGIGIRQHPTMKALITEQEIGEVVDMTHEILASIIATVVQTSPESRQNDIIDIIRERIVSDCVDTVENHIITGDRFEEEI